MKRTPTYTMLIGLAGLLLATGCRDESEELIGPPSDVAFSETSEGSFFEITGATPEELPAEETSAATASVSSVPAGSTVLDFEDLTHSGSSYHPMTPHNPYHGVSFSGSGSTGSPGIWHWNSVGYGRPHSGQVFLFNAYGQDNEYITFENPVTFIGAWVGRAAGAAPDYRFREFWFEGYLGGLKVGESSHLTTSDVNQHWLSADFGGPVDKVIFRIIRGPRGRGHWSMDDITFIANQPPTAHPDGPYSGDEGSEITFDGTGSSDPDGDALTYAWTFDDSNSGSGPTPKHTYADNGTYTVSLTVDDGNATDTKSTTATIANVAPTVGEINVPVNVVPLGTPIDASADFTDPGTADTHDAEWDWGDSNVETGTVTQGAGFGSVDDSHTYTATGLYTIQLTVTDDDGGSDTEVFEFVAVYDPSAGFVTGGGWIDSPAGAYRPDDTLAGRANFGFVAKYKKGADAPTGQTEFQFHVADLNFHSTSYDWLVVTGSDYAMFKGYGTINGMGDYRFMLWAGDKDPDTFRIRIWTEDEFGVETDVYDNGMDQAIGGGSVVLHTKK